MNVSYKMHAEVQGQLVESILFVMWILGIKFRPAIGALLACLSSFLNVRPLWMVLEGDTLQGGVRVVSVEL